MSLNKKLRILRIKKMLIYLLM